MEITMKDKRVMGSGRNEGWMETKRRLKRR